MEGNEMGRQRKSMLLKLMQSLCRCLVLLLLDAYEIAVTASTVTTNAVRYALGTPIILSWNYYSFYTDSGVWNFDVVAIFNNDTIPTLDTYNQVVQMSVFISTFQKSAVNETTRNVGTISFDGNAPDESGAQTWPLKGGYYKAYLINLYDEVFTLYAASDTFTVSPLVSSKKRSYYYNEPITFNWDYTSSYTGTGDKNEDFLGIYNTNNLFSPVIAVWISSLAADGANTTIRNIGTVTFAGQMSLPWPLEVGSYKAFLYNSVGLRKYTESDTFFVQPATVSPTKTPTKAPIRAPTKDPTKVPTKLPTNLPTKAPTTTSPSIAPIRKKKQLFCNVFFLRYIFCSDRCGFIGRLFNKC